MPGHNRTLAVAAVALFVTLGACSSANGPTATPAGSGGPAIVVSESRRSLFHGTTLDPPLPRPTQILRDTSGRTFSIADRPDDELTVLFFGYTHCPDLCPTTMADLASARGQLPASQRGRVTVVFVTEDPERDTPGPLRRWLDGFDPAFVGLSGGNTATQAMLKQLYLPQTRRLPHPEDPIEHPDDGGPHHDHDTYGVEHSGVVYAFGPGDSTLIYSGGTKPAEYAADFSRLITSNGER